MPLGKASHWPIRFEHTNSGNLTLKTTKNLTQIQNLFSQLPSEINYFVRSHTQLELNHLSLSLSLSLFHILPLSTNNLENLEKFSNIDYQQILVTNTTHLHNVYQVFQFITNCKPPLLS